MRFARTVSAALMLMATGLTSCSTPRQPNIVELEASGNFAGCIAQYTNSLSADGAPTTEVEREATGATYYVLGECSEALEDRQGAIGFYQKSAALNTSPTDRAAVRLRVIEAGGTLLSAAALQAENQAILSQAYANDQQAAAAEAPSADTSSANAALLGAAAGMMANSMNRSHAGAATQLSQNRSYQQSPAYGSPSPSHQTSTPVATLRYANQCVGFGPRTDGGDVGMSVINRCGATITVHTIGTLGIDDITVSPGTHNWSTLEKRLDYACFVEAGQQLCEK